jgi:methylenetetrahydrofolate reductase (NADPH)
MSLPGLARSTQHVVCGENTKALPCWTPDARTMLTTSSVTSSVSSRPPVLVSNSSNLTTAPFSPTFTKTELGDRSAALNARSRRDQPVASVGEGTDSPGPGDAWYTHVMQPPLPSFLDEDRFSILCEIEPPRRPDIEHVRTQIETLKPITDAFLIPDNHLGRATVSSVAVAHEVDYLGGRSIACLNARDRNLLGFRRDLLTAAAYGVDHFLFVYGDPPKEGRRDEDLTVRGMVDEVRSYANGPLFQGYPTFRIGTVAKVGRPLTWRAAADFLIVQITFSMDRLLRWRESVTYDGRVYAGVIVLASSRMAARINASLRDIRIPDHIVDKLDDDPTVGLDLAWDHLETIRESGAFDGVHLIPVSRYKEVADRLLRARGTGGADR